MSINLSESAIRRRLEENSSEESFGFGNPSVNERSIEIKQFIGRALVEDFFTFLQ